MLFSKIYNILNILNYIKVYTLSNNHVFFLFFFFLMENHKYQSFIEINILN